MTVIKLRRYPHRTPHSLALLLIASGDFTVAEIGERTGITVYEITTMRLWVNRPMLARAA